MPAKTEETQTLIVPGRKLYRDKHAGGRPRLDRLTPTQIKAVELMATRGRNVTVAHVAEQIGVTRRTLHRWLNDVRFRAALQARVANDLFVDRGQVARALVKGANTPGKGQAAMQRIFWQLSGLLRQPMELPVGPAGNQAETEKRALAALTPETQRMIIRDLEKAGLDYIELGGDVGSDGEIGGGLATIDVTDYEELEDGDENEDR